MAQLCSVLRLLFVGSVLASQFVHSSVGERGEVKLQCQANSCMVEFDVADGVHRVELVPETHSVFGRTAKAITLDGKKTLISNRQIMGQRYHTKMGDSIWGTALISHDQKHLLDGIFATEKHGVFEWKKDESSGAHIRKLSAISVNDVLKDLPGGKPWMKEKEHIRRAQFAGTLPPTIDPYVPNTVITFFPGCYPGDSVTHVLSMNVIITWGMFQDLTAGMSGDTATLQSAVLSQLESTWAVGKLLYLSQLNVRLELQNVIFSSSTDPLPLSISDVDGTCMNALGALPAFLDWVSVNNPLTPSGFWLLLSNCFAGIDGVTYVGNLCGQTNNGGVAAFSWIVMFHEIGHAFGSLHSFEYGIGLTGGIMDYANGLYNGVPQFHPFRRADVCPFLSYMVTENSCPFFTVAASNAVCGDGVLEPSEACECVDDSTNCGGCVDCKITDSSVQCDSVSFVMRYPDTPAMVIVQASDLADPSCCVNNLLSPPKTLCQDGINACGPQGQCVPICTTYLLPDNPNCGFDTSGCNLGCVWNNQCTFSLTYTTSNGQIGDISALPNGSQCYTSSNDIGICDGGGCVGSNTAPSSPSSFHPTRQPTKPPTTTSEGGATVTLSPSLDSTTSCSLQRTKKSCLRNACNWCDRTCVQSGTSCVGKAKAGHHHR